MVHSSSLAPTGGDDEDDRPQDEAENTEDNPGGCSPPSLSSRITVDLALALNAKDDGQDREDDREHEEADDPHHQRPSRLGALPHRLNLRLSNGRHECWGRDVHPLGAVPIPLCARSLRIGIPTRWQSLCRASGGADAISGGLAIASSFRRASRSPSCVSYHLPIQREPTRRAVGTASGNTTRPDP
jgi:hypothetical protein